MRKAPDFSDAYTSLDWADRQIDILAAEVTAFAEANPYSLTSEMNAEGWTLIYLANSKPVAKLFSAQVAAIIQAQRSSLDYMAVALAEANGANDPTETHFPVTKTLEGLSDKRTLKKIRALDPADQERILGLEPYAGGNDMLYALHSMNLESKHRRLGVLAEKPRLAAIRGGPGRLYQLVAAEPAILTNSRHLIAAVLMNGDLQFDFAVDVAFCDVPGTQAKPPAIPVLRNFGAMCRDIARVLAGNQANQSGADVSS